MHMDPALPSMVGSIVAILLLGILMRAMRQPHVVAYLIAGIVLGPHLLGFVNDHALLERLGAFGVVILMFFIGMEVTPQDLLEKWKTAILGTLLQVAASVGFAILLGYVLNWSTVQSVLMGFILALSSTAVVLNLLQARKELDSRHGRDALTVLLTQDVLVIPMLIIISMLSGEKVSAFELNLQIIGGILLLGIVAWITLSKDFRIPFISEIISRDHEVQVFAALVLCFGLALITGWFSLSAALGAFVAGMILAAARETEWVYESLEPFKIVFVALFFVSIGMLVDIPFILHNLGRILLLTALVLLLNTSINAVVFRGLGESWGHGILTGAMLAQIGEFSFILAAVGYTSGIIDPAIYNLVVAVIAISLIVSPIWISSIKKHLLSKDKN